MVFKNTYLGYNIFLIRVIECKYHGIEVHKRKLFLKKIYIYVDSTNAVNSIDSFKGEHFAPARLERMMYLCMIRMPSNLLVDFITILICKIIEYK